MINCLYQKYVYLPSSLFSRHNKSAVSTFMIRKYATSVSSHYLSTSYFTCAVQHLYILSWAKSGKVSWLGFSQGHCSHMATLPNHWATRIHSAGATRDHLSAKRAGAKLMDDSEGAVTTKTLVAARKNDSALSFHAHHTGHYAASICDRNRETTVTTRLKESLTWTDFTDDILLLSWLKIYWNQIGLAGLFPTCWDFHVETGYALIHVSVRDQTAIVNIEWGEAFRCRTGPHGVKPVSFLWACVEE